MVYNTLEEMQTDWANRAAGKLRADRVDPDNPQTVEAALTACVGGRRLFECWLAVHGPQEGEKICPQP